MSVTRQQIIDARNIAVNVVRRTRMFHFEIMVAWHFCDAAQEAGDSQRVADCRDAFRETFSSIRSLYETAKGAFPDDVLTALEIANCDSRRELVAAGIQNDPHLCGAYPTVHQAVIEHLDHWSLVPIVVEHEEMDAYLRLKRITEMIRGSFVGHPEILVSLIRQEAAAAIARLDSPVDDGPAKPQSSGVAEQCHRRTAQKTASRHSWLKAEPPPEGWGHPVPVTASLKLMAAVVNQDQRTLKKRCRESVIWATKSTQRGFDWYFRDQHEYARVNQMVLERRRQRQQMTQSNTN